MKKLPELNNLYRLEKMNLPQVQFKDLDFVECEGVSYPIKSIIIGSADKSLPTVGLFGGVHGLERIGSQVIIAYLHTLFHQLTWDRELQESSKNFRIVSIPILNPGGMARNSRSNPNDVDLMRNAPVEAQGKVLPLVSGHRISPTLPWYRGEAGKLEKESDVLIKFVREELLQAEVSIALDVHSGFGLRDQIWYPYAKTKDAFPGAGEALRLKGLLDMTYPNHIYKFESQSANYLTHGDLWDYIYDLSKNRDVSNQKLFLPLTLELGSWNWLRKNPLQFFSKLGLFHPIKEHRQARIMRRHILLINFLLKAAKNHSGWLTSS